MILSVTVADSLQGKYHNSNWNKRREASCTRGLETIYTGEKFLRAAYFVVSFPVLYLVMVPACQPLWCIVTVNQHS